MGRGAGQGPGPDGRQLEARRRRLHGGGSSTRRAPWGPRPELPSTDAGPLGAWHARRTVTVGAEASGGGSDPSPSRRRRGNRNCGGGGHGGALANPAVTGCACTAVVTVCLHGARPCSLWPCHVRSGLPTAASIRSSKSGSAGSSLRLAGIRIPSPPVRAAGLSGLAWTRTYRRRLGDLRSQLELGHLGTGDRVCFEPKPECSASVPESESKSE